MIHGLKKASYFLIFFCLLLLGRTVLAQDAGSLKLSITPPLYKINMDPGESWTSVVKLVNNNAYPVTIYAEVLDFKSGATGGVEFIKDSQGGNDKNSLSGWVEINREPMIIGPQASVELPFVIKLPGTADPGGHYAAILAGSKPPADQPAGSAIKISSMLASLLLVRVSGEVVEQGEIREFSVAKNLTRDLSAKIKVSFANTGNTHLQPQGDIKLTNMWGETRAVIPFNQKSSFGNVLPESEKQWEFDWQGTSSLFDAGRMRADLVIGFGEETTQTDVSTIYFWTFALKPTAIVLGIIILLLLIIILLIRRYINQSLRQVRAQAEILTQKENALKAAGAVRPVAAAVGDGSMMHLHGAPAQEPLSWSLFQRIAVFLLIIISAALIVFVFYYFGGFKGETTKTAAPITANDATEAVDQPTVVDQQPASSTASSTPDGTVTITDTPPVAAVASSSTTSPAVATTTEKKIIKISIQNGSGVSGAGARAAELIKSSGAEIVSLGNAANFDYQVTEIRYKIGGKSQAEAINLLLSGTATLIEDAKISEDAVVILGKDFK